MQQKQELSKEIKEMQNEIDEKNMRLKRIIERINAKAGAK